MEAEILKLLPWASVMAMLAVVGVLVKVAMAYGKTTDTAAAAKATAEAVDRELDAFKLEVSRTYAQATTIRDMRDEITASMNRLGDRLDRIVEFANRQGQVDRNGSHRS